MQTASKSPPPSAPLPLPVDAVGRPWPASTPSTPRSTPGSTSTAPAPSQRPRRWATASHRPARRRARRHQGHLRRRRPADPARRAEFAHSTPDADATAVARLRAAGAIILGKTHTTEFAYLDPAPTRNPWNRKHTPGGSSSGSAAAVAAGMVPLALGSQTVGSVLRPAAYCGIVGLKPTHGRISAAPASAPSRRASTTSASSPQRPRRRPRPRRPRRLRPADPSSVDAPPVETTSPPSPTRQPPRIGLARSFYRGHRRPRGRPAPRRRRRAASAPPAPPSPRSRCRRRRRDCAPGAARPAPRPPPATRASSPPTATSYRASIRSLIEAGLKVSAVDYLGRPLTSAHACATTSSRRSQGSTCSCSRVAARPRRRAASSRPATASSARPPASPACRRSACPAASAATACRSPSSSSRPPSPRRACSRAAAWVERVLDFRARRRWTRLTCSAIAPSSSTST